MNARKKMPASAKREIRMTYYHHRLFVASALVVAVLFLLAAPGAWAETYTSINNHYPSTFYNSGGEHNDAHYVDAVYFGGREIYFFTFISTENESWSRYLYFYSNTDPSYSSKIDIENTSELDFRIKVVAIESNYERYRL